jgi:hypothetical protein
MPTPVRVKHLRYEVQMLGETLRKLQERDFDDQWDANALIESFCVHARNLNEFFMEDGRHWDLLKASSFTDTGYRRPRKTRRRAALFKKIDRQIAHLTKRRTSGVRNKIDDRQRATMFAPLYADLRNFDLHLKPALRRKWKVIFEGT